MKAATDRDRLDALEDRSIFILREAYAAFPQLAMLWSIGKDSTVMLWLARRAFFGHVPFPLVHIDTGFKIPEMIAYRDKLAQDLGLTLIVGGNQDALEAKNTFPDGATTRIQCCGLLKTDPLRETLDGTGTRYRLNIESGKLERDERTEAYTGVIVGLRADEEGSRSKERYFSPRDRDAQWHLEEQPPEFWSQYKTDCAPGAHVRIHPLLDWTEVDIWAYIERESIPTVSLYYDQGDGTRYRSLGCFPCTQTIESNAKTPGDIVEELRSGRYANQAERSGRAQDEEAGGSLEALRREGYM